MNSEIDSYIDKQKSPQKEICRRLRQIILATFPGITEAMKWGVPAFGDGLFYVVALKDHVNLGFSSRELSKEEMALFDGGGKTTRHVQVATPDDIDEGRVTSLLDMVNNKNLST